MEFGLIIKDEEKQKKYQDWENNEEIQIFREYLRIPSVHPNVDYRDCVRFLFRLAEEIGLTSKIYYPVEKTKPVVVLTLLGTQPELPSIILNSHMDVVPVFEEYWTHKPFEAEMDEEGRIFARGAQDMKCCGMQYLSAIRYFKKKNVTFKRTIHVVFVPNEELGGQGGMADFVHTTEFRALNPGFSLDEGIASPTEMFNIYYAERCIWHIVLTINGNNGHGALLLKDTAPERLRIILDRFYDYRETQVQKLKENPDLTIGDVTTVNITMINGGVQLNTVPPNIKIMTDIRLAVDVNHEDFENMVKSWCIEAGDVEYEFDLKDPFIPPTNLDQTNVYWTAFKSAISELNLKHKVQVFPGGTDSRYLRSVGIPAIGFSPMNHTPVLLHDHDEFLQADIYLKGIEIYKKIISNVANA